MLLGRRFKRHGRVAEREEAGHPAGLGLERVGGQVFIGEATRIRDVVGAPNPNTGRAVPESTWSGLFVRLFAKYEDVCLAFMEVEGYPAHIEVGP